MTRRAHWSFAGVVFGVAFLSGCLSVNGPPFQKVQIPEGKSVIYVYRKATWGEPATHRPMVTCGQDGVDLGSGGYYPFIVDPGTTTCHASAIELTSEVSEVVDVRCAAGQETYVKERVDPPSFLFRSVRPHLYLMNNPVGEKEASHCNLQP